jgi:hypothetical protein
MRLAAMVMGMTLGGCSFMHVQGPPSPMPDRGAVSCTSSRIAPAIDLLAVPVIGTLGVGTTVLLAWEKGLDGARVAGIATVSTVVLTLVSGLWGLNRTHACREAKSRIARHPVVPARLTPAEANLEKAEALHRIAIEAARRGDCATVAQLDSEVRALDATFHATVHATDAELARCTAR